MSEKNNLENNEIKTNESNQTKDLGIDKSESGNFNNEEIKQIENEIKVNDNEEKNGEQKEESKINIDDNYINNINGKEEKKDEKNNVNNNTIKEEKKKNPLNDIMSKKYEARNDDYKYLVQLDEDKELENLINEHNDNSSDEDEDEDETFPFRIIGDVQKKGETLGKFNHRYLEIDSVKGILKRYKSSKEYPRHPLEIIPLKNLKALKKLAKELNKDCYDFEIQFFIEKGRKQEDKTQVYRVRHSESRNKWYDIILALWKHLVKGEKIPKINNHKLQFVDDQAGIIQDIKQHNDRSKVKTGKITLRNFKILGLLGVGGFSTVYKVQHIMTDKIYAMKVMNKNYIIEKRYLHYVVSEFEIMKSLSGFPFVLDLHYCFQTANFLYMIIDYCPNGDFTELKCINNLKLFFAEVILAFEHIHKHNTVYRDLKPENIILDEEGHIKVCDFNLAKSGVTKEKKAFSFCGSPMYLSPDMLAGKGVDGRCDIYGIGLIMYEMVTGSPAYTADDINQLYEDIKNNKINFNLPTLIGDIKDLILKILVPDPDKRISLEDMKKHPYFKDISFLKVFKREYGPIQIKKIQNKEEKRGPVLVGDNYFEKIDENKKKEMEKFKKLKEKEKFEQFKQDQLKLDQDKDYTFLEGKISVKEMKKDLKRDMKNYVREFYFVKKEDIKQTEDFQLTLNSPIDTKIDFTKTNNYI